ncbi:MAG: cyd operon YbgE family protein [Alphaproteobacteria bacterium]
MTVALGLTVALTFAPFAFAREMTASAHAGISVLLLGMCLCFAHGVGFAKGRVLSLVLSPVVAWATVAIGGGMLFFRS